MQWATGQRCVCIQAYSAHTPVSVRVYAIPHDHRTAETCSLSSTFWLDAARVVSRARESQGETRHDLKKIHFFGKRWSTRSSILVAHLPRALAKPTPVRPEMPSCYPLGKGRKSASTAERTKRPTQSAHWLTARHRYGRHRNPRIPIPLCQPAAIALPWSFSGKPLAAPALLSFCYRFELNPKLLLL